MTPMHFRFEDKPALALLDENNLNVSDQPFFIDGYDFGDRMLEDVMFEFKLDADGKGVTVSYGDQDAEYMGVLNIPHWMEAAANYAIGTDSVSKDKKITGDWYLTQRKDTPPHPTGSNFTPA